MKTSMLCRMVPFTLLAVGVLLIAPGSSASAQTEGNPLSIPLVSVRATMPATRELLCDPAICDAARPTPGVFVVSRQGGDLALELSVFVTYEGTAHEGTDYPALPRNVFFGRGVESVNISVAATYDEVTEGDESVVARLQPDPSPGPLDIPNYRLDLAQAVAELVIHDNASPSAQVVSIEATSRIAEESSFPLPRPALRGGFTIVRTGPTEVALTVFVHYGGTALPEMDYPALPWAVRIPEGADRVELELEIVPKPDDLGEPIEIIEAQISECPPLTVPPLGIPCTELYIDPARSNARVFIRDDGITTASLELTAPKNRAEAQAGQAIPIAATAIDLGGAIAHVDFFDGDEQIGDSTISFIRPPDPGSPILHEFVWPGASAGAHTLTARALNAAGRLVISAPIRILVGEDPPVAPVVSLRATRPETREPILCLTPPCPMIPNMPPAVFTFSRVGDTRAPLTVWYLLGGSARNGVDYVRLSGQATIPGGSESVKVSVAALPDTMSEGDNTVLTQLYLPRFTGPMSPSPIDPYRIDPANFKAGVIIHDSPIAPKPTPVVSIVAMDAFGREGMNPNGEADTAAFQVRRSGSTSDPLAVRFSLGGTASLGADYEAPDSPLIIPAGEQSAWLVIKPVDDLRKEPVETVVASLLADTATPTRHVLGLPRRAAAVLVDEDQARPPCLRLPDGLFNLCVATDISDCVRVEVTRDFKEWTPLCTVPVTQGLAHFVDPETPGRPYQFYRLFPVPCEP